MNSVSIDSTAQPQELENCVRAWALSSINHCYYAHFLAMSRFPSLIGSYLMLFMSRIIDITRFGISSTTSRSRSFAACWRKARMASRGA